MSDGRLEAIAEDLAGELLSRPLLERILRRCVELLGGDAGSVSSVDEAAGTYRKEAEVGVTCQPGRVFPLSEGMTGEVVRRRAPVRYDRYADVPGGHVGESDRATLRGVIGVPIEWHGRIIAACVVFSRVEGRVFTDQDAELLRAFARHAAVALVNAGSHEAAEERARLQAAGAERERLLVEVQGLLDKGLVDLNAELEQAERCAPAAVTGHLRRARAEAESTMTEVRRSLGAAGHSPLEDRTLEDALRAELGWARRARGADARLVIAGAPVPLDPALAEHVLSVAQEAVSNIVRHSGASTIRLGLVYNSAALALLVQDDGQGFELDAGDQRAGLGLRRMAELAGSVGGSATVESVPGWGTIVRASFPYQRTAGAASDRIDVLVVAAQPLTRAGISRLLAWSGQSVAVVGEVAGAGGALAAYDPDVVVVGPDVADQADAVRRISAAVVAICPAGDQHAVAEALLAGAHGCVETTADGPTLARAVVAASRGESLVPDHGIWAGRLTSNANPSGLTARELEVYALLGQGLSDKMIAARLTIAVKTVEKHVGAVLRKTGCRGRAELIARGRRAG
ncbi:GAF domain-containing protein [Asanoa sp. WMMD1127]|uniref:GAF domain-containing protein n=1 Tax=Asanoa sp. WMMD1127 TaxID=3016107 RepID=UPI0024173EF4|nr:GAF domain-containing protein [Asanoa sp. WMMD1127]MDG4825264.1 GAF domain-containing protein [Asanoa sp. WMMD1127]